jgi:radical SAM additional 4Fe4S-binding domain
MIIHFLNNHTGKLMIHIRNNVYAKQLKENIIALWDSGNMSVAFVKSEDFCEESNDIVSHINKKKDPEINNFFCACDEECMYEGQVNINQMVLLVSNQCNYNCTYCQIENNIPSDCKINMSKDTALKALTVFKKNANKDASKTLTITGGEPLMNFEVVKFIILTAQKMFQDIRIVLFTNGSLITTKIADFLSDNQIQVLVSIDGPDLLHDSVRKDVHGAGTYEKTLKGYKTLQEAKCNVGVSSVGGIHNYRNYNELIELYQELSPDSVGYNIPHLLLEKDNRINIPISIFTDTIIQLYLGIRKSGIYLENISRVVNSFANRISRKTECQAQGKGFTVDSRGMVGPCKSLVINDIISLPLDDEMKISDIPIFVEWSKRSPLRNDSCIVCPARKLCGGGCAYDSYIRYNKDFSHMDERICEYHMGVLAFLLNDLYDHIKENFKSDFYAVSVEEQRNVFMQYLRNDKSLHKSIGHE